ncbi:hypothetical protein [Moraxella lacunata]
MSQTKTPPTPKTRPCLSSLMNALSNSSAPCLLSSPTIWRWAMA